VNSQSDKELEQASYEDNLVSYTRHWLPFGVRAQFPTCSPVKRGAVNLERWLGEPMGMGVALYLGSQPSRRANA
jgi:hypothetical protein